MTFLEILYDILIKPLQLFFEVLFTCVNRITDNPGMSIVVLSLAMNFLVLPLYKRADAMQEEEKNIEAKLHDGVAHIKKCFSGDERMMILQTYYRQNDYRPTDVFKSSVSLFLEIPFFIAAYRFLSQLESLQGTSFWIIHDLGAADGILSFAGHHVNLLPIVMTTVNLISCAIFTKGYPVKTKIQLYGMAVFFLFFLYGSPAGLVFYWTLNNIFSLVKTIFYKLKNPRKVLNVLFSITGLLVVLYGAFIFATPFLKRKLIVIGLGILCEIPLLLALIKKHITFKKITLPQANSKIFFGGAAFLTVLIGLIIPSNVISASPQEFCDIHYFLHPGWFIVSAFCIALGTFAVWMGVFYWLTPQNKRNIFESVIVASCIVTAVNYYIFGENFGLISNTLVYDDELVFSSQKIFLNLLIILILIIGTVLIFKFANKIIPQIIMVACLALVILAGVNIVKINNSISQVKLQVKEAEENEAGFTLSKTGKNVIVIMLDRGMNEYVPYIMNEKPELMEKFSGFTYYANTVSFGPCTNIASPALYGGYEYTPVELDLRSSESLVSKHNEALKVMPVLFSENGFEVTVCDPTYANYQWIPDTSIYDEYSDIKAYITEGNFTNEEVYQYEIDNNKRNFFCFAFTKTMPLLLQKTLYQKGTYNNSGHEMVIPDAQDFRSNTTSYGINKEFDKAFLVLENMSSMTEITDDKTNTFMMISNNTTHDPELLQEPGYTQEDYVDNTEYEAENSGRFTVDGKTLHMDVKSQIIHYHANMAAFI